MRTTMGRGYGIIDVSGVSFQKRGGLAVKTEPLTIFFSSVDMPATWIETNVETDSTKPCNQKQAVHIPSPCI